MLALRLGLRMVRGMSEAGAQRIVAAREVSIFADVADLVHRAGLNEFERTRLADAGALRSLAGHRHRARWAVQGAETPPKKGGQSAFLAGSGSSTPESLPEKGTLTPFFRIAEERVQLKPPTRAADTFADYAQLGYTLGAHPVALVRRQLRLRGARSARELERIAHGTDTRVAGLVTVRQRPASASNVTFLTLEDETGLVNIVVWQQLALEQRRELLESRLLAVDGTLEKVDGVQHLIARRLHNYNALIGSLDARSRDFH